jgi:hypothetical protein
MVEALSRSERLTSQVEAPELQSGERRFGSLAEYRQDRIEYDSRDIRR